jgi:NAD(P)-dependent dehydrogenase (short-subunit alcohol dehydrogenase family)
MSLADWRRQTAVNLDGVFLSVKYAVPAMRHDGGGSIIITSSTAGLRGSAGLAGYCATKGGVRLFAKAVAMECAVEANGIRVNTVHPGVIDTPIWTKLPVSAGSNAPIDPNQVAKAGVPLGRAGQAQDIANGVLFLASDASSYMTGAELVIDGGMTGCAPGNSRIRRCLIQLAWRFLVFQKTSALARWPQKHYEPPRAAREGRALVVSSV